MSDSNYETEVTLPSRGLLYKNIPATLTLRAITTADEKKYIGSDRRDDPFTPLVRSCVVYPEQVDLSELLFSDLLFLLLRLRVHTYGNEISLEEKCPVCKAVNYFKFNLDSIPVNELSDDFEEPVKITLPVKGDAIEFQYLRRADEKWVEEFSRKTAKKRGLNVKELEYIYRIVRMILTVNGNKFDSVIEAARYVEGLHGKDTAYLFSKYNEFSFGPDPSISHTCDKCGNDIETVVPLTGAFFRPVFD